MILPLHSGLGDRMRQKINKIKYFFKKDLVLLYRLSYINHFVEEIKKLPKYGLELTAKINKKPSKIRKRPQTAFVLV